MSRLKFEVKFLITYLLIGGLWIKFSDIILSKLVSDPALITNLQTYKGWFFVAATAFLFFFIIKNHLIKIRDAEQQAINSDKLKTLFLQNISHEIRTPMNAIIGFTTLLSYKNLSEEYKDEYIPIIKNSSLQLLSIVNDVLDISMIESGNLKLNQSYFNLNALLDEIYETYHHTAPAAITLKISKTLADTNCTLFSDKSKVQQILNNLINNALKFTEAGYVHFGYSAENNQITFFVEDTGIGIAEDLHEKIFDRFAKADSGFTKRYDGIGLGLSICQGHVSLLKGEIWLKSALGEGSTFYFTIPKH